MKRLLSIPALLMLFAIISCNSGVVETNDDPLADSTTEETVSTEAVVPAADRKPTDDEIREYGKIVMISDGAYPMFGIDMEFPERKMKMGFSLNVEAIALAVTDLNNLKDKYATIYYTSDMEPFINDIKHNGQSLLGQYAHPNGPEDKTITGILKGAGQMSSGDLPDEVSITDKGGKVLKFDYFIDEALVSANGKEVTVLYNERAVNNITYMKGAE